MSNKTELQDNNLELQGILDSVNALPNVGGAGIEKCSVLIYNAGSMAQQLIPYINSNGTISCMCSYEEIYSMPFYDSESNSATIYVPKGAVIMKCGGELSSIPYGSENIENITPYMNIDWATDGQLQFYQITGDVEISW